MNVKSNANNRLTLSGWKTGDARDFLGLTNAESELIDMKIALGEALRSLRERTSITQTALAERIGSSQSRIAKMEAGEPSVSFDLMVRAFLALGASRRQIGLAFTARAA